MLDRRISGVGAPARLVGQDVDDGIEARIDRLEPFEATDVP